MRKLHSEAPAQLESKKRGVSWAAQGPLDQALAPPAEVRPRGVGEEDTTLPEGLKSWHGGWEEGGVELLGQEREAWHCALETASRIPRRQANILTAAGGPFSQGHADPQGTVSLEGGAGSCVLLGGA